MRWKLCLMNLSVVSMLATAGMAGTFGTVVPIGGEGSDLALDEARGVLYIADFTGNRIDVMSLATHAIQTSFNVGAQPSSIALSPDDHYLLVTQYGNFVAPQTQSNALTVIDLTTNAQNTLAVGSPPLGVAFGYDGLALVVTSTQFLLFDPNLQTFTLLGTVAGVTAATLPAPPANFPPQITQASLGVSADGRKIYGTTSTILLAYDAVRHLVSSVGYVSTPIEGPRVVNVNKDGSYWVSGWTLFDANGDFYSQFPNASGLLNIGTTLIDSGRNLIYAQIPVAGTTVGNGSFPTPLLTIADAQNLQVYDNLQLPENLAGKSVLSRDGSAMYALSDSGVMILPIGSLPQTHRVAAEQWDLIFRSSLCSTGVSSQDLNITDPGGNQTTFQVSTDAAGVTIQPSSGVTPATIHVSVDANTFLGQNGTSVAMLNITSLDGVNMPHRVRVLVNTNTPDERGTIVDVPGTLVDVLADPVRNRFYALRQDSNQVLVYDATTYNQIATLKTNNTPTQMAITWDHNWLLVGHDNSQFLYVFNLNTLQPSTPVRMPSGHYPRSVAASGNAILVANRVAGPTHTIDRVDMNSRTASQLPSLGAFENTINVDTRLVAAPNGASIMAVEADGNVLLYDANQDTFTISRKDYPSLGGAYAASSWGMYAVGNYLLDSSLVTRAQLASTTGTPSGFAFVDQFGFRANTPASPTTFGTAISASSPGPGVMERLDLSPAVPSVSSPTNVVEAPLAPETGFAFSRTLAPLANQTGIVLLTTSGFTVLPWTYDNAVAPPNLNRVVSAADGSAALAPGGLISLYGNQLSPVSMASSQIPLPTALADTCLTVNGEPVPVMFVSSSQINAQLPFEANGNVTFTLRTPGGISNNLNTAISGGAPSVFQSGTAGPITGIPTIVRAANNQLVTASNPVRPGDTLVIYLTGLGATNPGVASGAAAPMSPLARTVATPGVTLGSSALHVFYSGLTPTLVGVYQINATVPKGVSPGMSVPLAIAAGGNTATVNVRVVN